MPYLIETILSSDFKAASIGRAFQCEGQTGNDIKLIRWTPPFFLLYGRQRTYGKVQLSLKG